MCNLLWLNPVAILQGKEGSIVTNSNHLVQEIFQFTDTAERTFVLLILEECHCFNTIEMRAGYLLRPEP